MYSVKAHLSQSGCQSERSIRFILHAHGRSHYIVMSKYWFWLLYGLNIVNRGNGYETRQSSLLYVFVLFFGLDPAQDTIVVYSVLRN